MTVNPQLIARHNQNILLKLTQENNSLSLFKFGESLPSVTEMFTTH